MPCTLSSNTATAQWDAQLHAQLGEPRPLTLGQFTAEQGAAVDIPHFVRAASAIRRWCGQRVIVQDDVNALAMSSGALTSAQPLLLPQGVNERRRFEKALGNKHDKLDLEAAVVLPDGRLLVLGSGSTAARERLVLVTLAGAVRVVDAAPLYAELRAHTLFAGSELNIEGALIAHETLVLVQRGNGATLAGRAPVNALGELSLREFLHWLDAAGPAPQLRHHVAIDLGSLAGCRLSFTDAVWHPSGQIAFIACAEASPDVVADGEVHGVCFGWINAEQVRLAQILDAAGRCSRLKLEGIETSSENELSFDVVADVDDANQPALAATLRVATL